MNNSNFNNNNLNLFVDAPLFLINAHSKDTDKYIDIDDGITVFHYCKKGCKFKTFTEVSKNDTRLVRAISSEYACMSQLTIHDTFKNSCPDYKFNTSLGEIRHGVFMCKNNPNGIKSIDIVYKMKPNSVNTLSSIIKKIRTYLTKNKMPNHLINIGLLACRHSESCAMSIHGLPENVEKNSVSHNPKETRHIIRNQTHVLNRNRSIKNYRNRSRSIARNRSRNRSRSRNTNNS